MRELLQERQQLNSALTALAAPVPPAATAPPGLAVSAATASGHLLYGPQGSRDLSGNRGTAAAMQLAAIPFDLASVVLRRWLGGDVRSAVNTAAFSFAPLLQFPTPQQIRPPTTSVTAPLSGAAPALGAAGSRPAQGVRWLPH